MMVLLSPTLALAELPGGDTGAKLTSDLAASPEGDEIMAGCNYSIWLYDSYGDGWNGCSLDVFVNGALVLDNITLSSGSGPAIFSFPVTEGAEITTLFNAGSWIYEPYYYVYDYNNVQVFYVPNNGNPVIYPGQLYAACPPGGAVEGYVFNYYGLAIAGAIVGQEDGPTTTTDASGYYFLSDVAAGDQVILAYKTGYNVASAVVTIIANSTVTQDFTLTQPNMVISPLFIEQTLNPNEYYTTNISILNMGMVLLAGWQKSSTR